VNSFEEFVNSSESIKDNVAIIGRHEDKRDQLGDLYGKPVNDLRVEFKRWEAAFNDVVVWYNAQLPHGWYVAANFGAWVLGKACVQFVHGSLTTEARDVINIGGDCVDLHELQYRMDNVVRFINSL